MDAWATKVREANVVAVWGTERKRRKPGLLSPKSDEKLANPLKVIKG